MVKEREHDKQKGTIVGYGTCQNPWPRFYIPNNEEMRYTLNERHNRWRKETSA